ncbi:MAG: Flp family type IVb pilin [Alphaproteobacteria bacterium]|nr:Flp family type IVb pilin [Alphaproteobacteria bacterium]
MRRFIHAEDAATAIEYSMIAALIAILIISSLFTMGTTVEDMFEALMPAFAGPTP